MQLAAILVIAVVVVAVAIDAIGRLDERRAKPQRDEASITTQKIIVDLTKRR
jgi:hypothetical protein